MRLAESPAIYQPLWYADIIGEMRSTLQQRFGISASRIAHLESKLLEHFPEAWVRGFEPLIPKMKVNDKDRHVLAAAIHANAAAIVTYNLRHFPANPTKPWNVVAVGPSAFLKDLCVTDPGAVIDTLREQAADIHRTFVEQLRVLYKAVPGFVELVARDTQTEL